MNDSARVLLLTETFEHKVIPGRLFVLYKIELVGCPFVLGLDHQGVGTLADLAFECFPEECREVG